MLPNKLSKFISIKIIICNSKIKVYAQFSSDHWPEFNTRILERDPYVQGPNIK
jgi:hypothetical protein